MIKLIPIDEIKASEYNPRKNDEKRLDLTEMSLRKLGFVLPIYADTSGEILSVHQRHFVAKRMGFTKVPVEYVNNMELEERKVVNILFNRATNDLQKLDTVNKIKERLFDTDLASMKERLPDIEPDSKESFPCVYALQRKDTISLAKVNHRSFDQHIMMLAQALEKKTGTLMPIVICEDQSVVNGIGRLQLAAEKNKKFVQCVTVSEDQKAFASAMLNLLSMDFSMDGEYADTLRYNSFMRERNTRETDAEGNCAFGDGFFKGIFPNSTGRDFFKLEGEPLAAWTRHYGDKIVDFGAGKLNNTRTLRNAGLFVSAFEPYFIVPGDKVHKGKSVEIAEKFLDDVESGVEYTSIFISSVFNSIPFMADRIKVAYIAAALCYPGGKVVCWCQSDQAPQFKKTRRASVRDNKSFCFSLDYEPNVNMGDLSKHPKVQKGHQKNEMVDIFGRMFGKINRLDMISAFWYLEASEPKLDLNRLGEALDFEFDLPYPDGTRMGLADRARKAFEKRLGVEIPGKEVYGNEPD